MQNKTYVGQSGITKVKVLADSISEDGKRLFTVQVEVPRIVLAEINTHRMLSKNTASSRAIPFERMLEQLNGRPVRFGKHQAGMQDAGEHVEMVRVKVPDWTWGRMEYEGFTPSEAWEDAKGRAIEMSKAFYDAGYSKQVYNRLTEAFQMSRMVISGTEWANFFWLRNHSDADPTLQELATVIQQAYGESEPQFLKEGQWHLPYVDVTYDSTDENCQEYWDNDVQISLRDAIQLSVARCAAVSYRTEDLTLGKAKNLYERLVGGDRVHASPLEHIGTPMSSNPVMSDKGVTHLHKTLGWCSGNFSGWFQWRQMIDKEHTKW